MSNYSKFFIIFILIIVLIPNLFIPTMSFSDFNNTGTEKIMSYYNISKSEFCWPIPGYTKISSYFGKRNSPVAGASSYHLGLDIPAPEGTNLVAPIDSIVSFIGFNGSGGYAIILKKENLQFVYHHVSPNYIIQKGNTVLKGQVIGNVGPKNIYGILNNPYKDSNGKPTNGATTGPHLHFTIKKDGKAVNPLDYF